MEGTSDVKCFVCRDNAHWGNNYNHVQQMETNFAIQDINCYLPVTPITHW